MIYEDYVVNIDPYERWMPDKTAWEILIIKAFEEDEYMAAILWWYRATGAELVENEKFGYVIKPIIGDDGWSSKEEWEQEKEWLKKYAKQVMKLLKEVRKETNNVGKYF